ncbi:MAG TPA: DsrE/DsrF/DrsH-like family protein [Candidatus Aquicultor sp.]|jgi:peroxiredoxin family protein
MEMQPKLSIVLISPQLERMQAGTMMGAIAATSGMQVNFFVTMGAMEMLLKKTVEGKNFPIESDVGKALMEKSSDLYYKLLEDAKEIGDAKVYACALAVDLMGWAKDEMLDVIDDIVGVSEFFGISEGGMILTI